MQIILPGTTLPVDADKSVAGFIDRHRRKPDHEISRQLAIASFLDWSAVYKARQFRPNPDGDIILVRPKKWARRNSLLKHSDAALKLFSRPERFEFIGESEGHNLIPTEGRNSILDIYLDAATQITTWYMAPFEGNYTPLATDTAANVVANSTECTAYDEATRSAITWGEPSSGSLDNSASVETFTISATKTIYGAFIVSVSTKSATTGTLCSISRFSASRAVVDNDVLNVTATVALTSS